jgi:hypothetical protein
VTRCRHHLFFRTPLRAVAVTFAQICGPTSAGCTAKGTVSSSTTYMLCCCHPGAPTKTFVIWLQFCTYDLSTHGSSAFYSRPFMFVLLPAQVPTCCVCLANVACWDVHLARPRPPGKEFSQSSWLAGEKRPAEIREGPIKPQPLSNWQPPSCDLAVSTSGREITKGGVMQWTCRRSPSRYINLPGSLPEYPRPSH